MVKMNIMNYQSRIYELQIELGKCYLSQGTGAAFSGDDSDNTTARIVLPKTASQRLFLRY